MLGSGAQCIRGSRRRQTDGKARAALADLCRLYRPPILAYIRSHGYTAHDSEDLTQIFLVKFAGGNLLEGVAPAKGRFRTFVRVCLRHFLRDEHDRSKARKRGGDIDFVPLDVQQADHNPTDSQDAAGAADLAFDLCWARALVEGALARLREECEARAQPQTFQVLAPWLEEEADGVRLTEAAHQLGISREAARLRVRRLRDQYGAILRQELARTVDAPDEIESELRYLLRVIAASR